MPKCEKCQDRGFIEKEHGLIMVQCDCPAGSAASPKAQAEKDEAERQAERTDEVVIDDTLAEDTAAVVDKVGDVLNDSSDGAEQDNRPAGSGDTGEPEQPKKPKKKRKSKAKRR